ncbi:MAG: hypothetical protein JWM56_688 [Candidatus Peribacteria bacterium]|nr:hypothetical protein [Candidatus Peribacteria bacterium]
MSELIGGDSFWFCREMMYKNIYMLIFYNSFCAAVILRNLQPLSQYTA